MTYTFKSTNAPLEISDAHLAVIVETFQRFNAQYDPDQPFDDYVSDVTIECTSRTHTDNLILVCTLYVTDELNRVTAIAVFDADCMPNDLVSLTVDVDTYMTTIFSVYPCDADKLLTSL